MTAEKPSAPKELPIAPEMVRPLDVSAITAIAAAKIAEDIAKDLVIPKEHAEALAESIASDMSREGLSQSDKQKESWKNQVVDTLKGVPDKFSQTFVETNKDVDPFDYKAVDTALSKIVETYGMQDALPTWKTTANVLSSTAVIRNGIEGVKRWFGTEKQVGVFRKKMDTLLKSLPKEDGVPTAWSNVSTTRAWKEPGHKANIVSSLAKAAWPVWGPFVAQFPVNWVEQRAFTQFDQHGQRLADAVNDRVSRSLVMREFQVTKDKPPAEMMTVINKGRQATIDLVDTAYTQLMPYTWDLRTFPTKLIGRSWVEAGLAAVKIPMLRKDARTYANEMMKTRKKELDAWNKVNARLLSTIGSLESIKTSDSMEKAAASLKEGIVSRDFIRSGGLASQDGPMELASEKWFKYLDVGVPALNDVLQIPKQWNKFLSTRENTLALMRKENITLQDFENVFDPAAKAKVDTFIRKVTLLDSVSKKKKPDVDVSQWNVTPDEAKMLGIVGKNKDLATYGIESAIFAGYHAMDASYLQQEIKGKYLGLAALYVNRILPMLQDIEKMDELLGPYDTLDVPNGPKELVRKPVSAVKRFDISAKHLDFGPILSDVTLDIPQGSFVTIKGASGHGKTTFMRHLLGLYEGDGGEVSIGGTKVSDIKKYGPDSIYTKVAYAPQHTEFFEDLTLRENLVAWTQKQIPDEEIHKTLVDLNLGHLVDRLDSTKKHFSGGELRRIGIARALLKDPKVLFLDEPTANLDDVSAKQVMNIIQELRAKQPDMTVVAITHDPAFEKIAEKVVDFETLNKKPELKPIPTETLSDRQILVGMAKP